MRCIFVYAIFFLPDNPTATDQQILEVLRRKKRKEKRMNKPMEEKHSE